VFTGIVEEVGEVVVAGDGVLRIRGERVLDETKLGDSIAVDGVDLTVTEIVDQDLRFNVMPETYRLTTLGLLRPGKRVNLERSVRAADRLSGHVVRGVVEGVGRLEARREDGDATIITYSAPSDILSATVERGPVCVDGISLTVIAKDYRRFSVSIVRFTAKHTTVLEKQVGDLVNLESDVTARYVAQAVQAQIRLDGVRQAAPAAVRNASDYDEVGRRYVATRRPDPRIASALRHALGDASSVVNIGAGSGAYEPADLDVIAVEPSRVMIDQRPADAAPAILGSAEALPLDDKSVDAALAVLTVHHWPDLECAWAEIRRVVRRRAVFLTFDPAAPPFWLTRDYLPEIRELDALRLPPLSVFDQLGAVEVRPLPIPHDCTDGFLAAFWRRPADYLDPTVQANISALVALEPSTRRRGLDALRRDLADGTWASVNRELADAETLDAGYRIVICTLG
jgi:riboflavin synthase alpha subunit